MGTLKSRHEYLVYSLLCAAADGLDFVLSAFGSKERPSTDFFPSDMDGLNDEEILELRRNAARLSSDHSIFQLTPYTVSKTSQDPETCATDSSEANALELVFAKTTIPVPRVRRVINQDWYRLIIMDYIKGPTLAESWSSFPFWRKLSVAFTLRRYIRQLRRLKVSPTTPPGPLSSDGPRICGSPIFGQDQSGHGPFASYAELSMFFNKRHTMAMNAGKVPDDHPLRTEFYDDSFPLVLTYQDLNPRNIIVGDDGRLWIIDWAWAGYYPAWFEYVAMREQAEHKEMIGFNYKYWESLVSFVCGPYFEQEKWWWRMARAFSYA